MAPEVSKGRVVIIRRLLSIVIVFFETLLNHLCLIGVKCLLFFTDIIVLYFHHRNGS